ncbi:MAG: Spy/CpxP family protein refolding chaperone [Caulobacterales bacterium]|nr:Spy/CpxP family protein refolding chaperone [Caulobacterales bacterium]
MTKTPLTWLLAGAALTLTASVAVAAADPQDDARAAARQANEDARTSAADDDDARDAARAARHEHHELRIYRHDGDDVTIVRDGRPETLSSVLQLRPDQEPALKAFLEATRPAHDHEHMSRIDRDDPRTTLQKLDEMQARLSQQQAEMARKIAAVRAFYAQLDERQKKAFDAMPMIMVAGPNVGPILVPHVMPIVDRSWPTPPTPTPTPPVPPMPPRPPGA